MEQLSALPYGGELRSGDRMLEKQDVQLSDHVKPPHFPNEGKCGPPVLVRSLALRHFQLLSTPA